MRSLFLSYYDFWFRIFLLSFYVLNTLLLINFIYKCTSVLQLYNNKAEIYVKFVRIFLCILDLFMINSKIYIWSEMTMIRLMIRNDSIKRDIRRIFYLFQNFNCFSVLRRVVVDVHNSNYLINWSVLYKLHLARLL